MAEMEALPQRDRFRKHRPQKPKTEGIGTEKEVSDSNHGGPSLQTAIAHQQKPNGHQSILESEMLERSFDQVRIREKQCGSPSGSGILNESDSFCTPAFKRSQYEECKEDHKSLPTQITRTNDESASYATSFYEETPLSLRMDSHLRSVLTSSPPTERSAERCTAAARPPRPRTPPTDKACGDGPAREAAAGCEDDGTAGAPEDFEARSARLLS